MNDVLTGVVTEYNENKLWVVECPEAPKHLRTHFLRPQEIAPKLRGRMHVDMAVQLEYMTDRRTYGTWMLTKELTDE